MVLRWTIWTASRVAGALILMMVVNSWHTGVEDGVKLLAGADSLPVVRPEGCLRPAPQLGVAPVICVKPDSEDQVIGRSLKEAGQWEGSLVTEVLQAVTRHPGSVFVGGLPVLAPPVPRPWVQHWCVQPDCGRHAEKQG